MDPQTLRVFGIVSDSIVDGPGLRLSVFTQGCPHGCPGCHNPESHDPSGGRDAAVADIVLEAKKNPLLSGVTLTGGEPMQQAAACAALVRLLPRHLNVWVFSGYTYEEILQSGDADRLSLLNAADVLVDGRFVLAKRSLSLPFRGSANQRLIDLNETRKTGRVTLWTPPVW